MSTSGRGQAGSNKPPDPVCRLCGSPLAKSPLGISALREMESTTHQMKQHAMRAVKKPTMPRGPGYR